MTSITHTTTAARRPDTAMRKRLDEFFASLGQGFNAYLERRCRTEEIERLNAKSDEELAKMGLNRRDIPRYVFRDMLYL